METENGAERVARYLARAIAMEAASVAALGALAEAATDHAPLYRACRLESEGQKRRLEARYAALGAAPLEGRRGETVGGAGDTAELCLLRALALESLGVVAYEMLLAAAKEIDDTETAALALRLQAQESAMARQLFAQIALPSDFPEDAASRRWRIPERRSAPVTAGL